MILRRLPQSTSPRKEGILCAAVVTAGVVIGAGIKTIPAIKEIAVGADAIIGAGSVTNYVMHPFLPGAYQSIGSGEIF